MNCTRDEAVDYLEASVAVLEAKIAAQNVAKAQMWAACDALMSRRRDAQRAINVISQEAEGPLSQGVAEVFRSLKTFVDLAIA